VYQPLVRALVLIESYMRSGLTYYPADEPIPLDGIVRPMWRDLVIEDGPAGEIRIVRVHYKLCALQALRDAVRSKEVWVVGARRFRNPDEDLPTDFEVERANYYLALHKPEDPAEFIAGLRSEMERGLAKLDLAISRGRAKGVKIADRGSGWIQVSPLAPLPDPPVLGRLKTEVATRWPMTGLLDVLKETALRTSFVEAFTSVATREALDPETLQKRILLCLFAMGTNAGLKRLAGADPGTTYSDLRYIRSRYITREQVRAAIAQVVNEIFHARNTQIWGEATSACASDSKKFGAWDQNLMTEWSARHFGRGVMVYWHVETKSVCVYSQIKTISSSEVAAMIEGVLRHCTEMEIEKNYVDTHGQSEVGFAFCHLLGFRLMPRLKRIGVQRLYRPVAGRPKDFDALQPVLTRPIDWDLIAQQYDQMIKYATALRLGTAETESILRRFTRTNLQHPTYRALQELGKAVKTVFLCEYLASEEVRREVHDALNVIENWNSANAFIFFGRGGELATNRTDEQELSVLCLHLLQNSLVYINTLMLQHVLRDRTWAYRPGPRDLRALTPLFYVHVNPYGRFSIDLHERLPGLPERRTG
jgi:TnpA family transposase